MVSEAKSAATPIAATRLGKLKGDATEDIIVYRGIPYAAAPVGERRWKAPIAPATWSGIRASTSFGANCLQNPAAWLSNSDHARYSEDCLFLNVWRPREVIRNAPVLVWIHGGAFIHGGTSFPVFDGSAFARQGVVFVSINYRLGRQGFFAHPSLTREAAGPLGNYGYLDQIKALEWVRSNIAAFGGDPHRVTVMGESAGGISVLDLLVSPLAKGLFQQAVVMSGGGRAAMSNHPLHDDGRAGTSAEANGIAFAGAVGLADAEHQTPEALRSLPAEVLLGGLTGSNLGISGDIKGSDRTFSGTHVGGPIIDGQIKLSLIDDAIRRGDAARIPVMIGTTSADLPVPTGQTKDELFATFGHKAVEARKAFDPSGDIPAGTLRDEITRDRLLVEPARFVAKEVAKSGQHAWLYDFGYIASSKRTEWTGVPHGGDTATFFDTMRAQFGTDATSDEDDRAVRVVNAYLVNFVRRGDPNGTDRDGRALPVWADFAAAPSKVMALYGDRSTGMVERSDNEKMDLIEASVSGLQPEK
ncbi:MAG: carboxylesterase family protein [Novosphingobium sp.]